MHREPRGVQPTTGDHTQDSLLYLLLLVAYVESRLYLHSLTDTGVLAQTRVLMPSSVVRM